MTIPTEMERREVLAPGYLAATQTGKYFVEAIEQLHADLRPDFEEKVWTSGPSARALAAAQITARAVSLIGPVAALDEANEIGAASSLMRTVEENASNLFYILYAGPAEERGTPEEFADQFLSYRHVDQAKHMNKSREDYRGRFAAGFKPPSGPRTLGEFEHLCDQIQATCDATKATFPTMTKTSWHNIDKETRTKRVLHHLPPFAAGIRPLWKGLSGITTLHNIHLHSGPMLFERDPARLTRGRILESEAKTDVTPGQAHAAAKFAEMCWCALADLFDEADFVTERSKQLQFQALDRLFERMRVPAMIRVD